MKVCLGVFILFALSLSSVAEAAKFSCRSSYRKEIAKRFDWTPPTLGFMGHAFVMMHTVSRITSNGQYLLGSLVVGGAVAYGVYRYNKHVGKGLVKAAAVIEESYTPDEEEAILLFENNYWKTYNDLLERKLLLEINPKRISEGKETLVLEEYLLENPRPELNRSDIETPLQKLSKAMKIDYATLAKKIHELSFGNAFCPKRKPVTLGKLKKIVRKALKAGTK